MTINSTSLVVFVPPSSMYSSVVSTANKACGALVEALVGISNSPFTMSTLSSLYSIGQQYTFAAALLRATDIGGALGPIPENIPGDPIPENIPGDPIPENIPSIPLNMLNFNTGTFDGYRAMEHYPPEVTSETILNNVKDKTNDYLAGYRQGLEVSREFS